MKLVNKTVQQFGLLVVLLGVALSVGCSKSDSSDNRGARGTPTNLAPGTGSSGVPASATGYYTQVEVAISGTEQAAKDFLMPSVLGDATKIGSITAGNVKMKGYVVVNRSNGQIDIQQSNIFISIRDSLTGTTDNNGKPLPPFEIYLPAKSGTVSGSNVDITFGDSFGSVHMVATMSGATCSNSQITGRIEYANKAPYQSNGTLGQFTILTCGFIDAGK